MEGQRELEVLTAAPSPGVLTGRCCKCFAVWQRKKELSPSKPPHCVISLLQIHFSVSRLLRWCGYVFERQSRWEKSEVSVKGERKNVRVCNKSAAIKLAQLEGKEIDTALALVWFITAINSDFCQRRRGLASHTSTFVHRRTEVIVLIHVSMWSTWTRLISQISQCSWRRPTHGSQRLNYCGIFVSISIQEHQRSCGTDGR